MLGASALAACAIGAQQLQSSCLTDRGEPRPSRIRGNQHSDRTTLHLTVVQMTLDVIPHGAPHFHHKLWRAALGGAFQSPTIAALNVDHASMRHAQPAPALKAVQVGAKIMDKMHSRLAISAVNMRDLYTVAFYKPAGSKCRLLAFRLHYTDL
jgi:hypothetical protein